MVVLELFVCSASESESITTADGWEAGTFQGVQLFLKRWNKNTWDRYYRCYIQKWTHMYVYIYILHRVAMSYHKVCKLLNHMYTLSTDWGSEASSTSVDSNKTQAGISFICLSCINNICSRTWATLPKELLQFRHVQTFPAAWNLQNGTALDLIKLGQYK